MEGIPLTRASQLVHVTDAMERLGLPTERMFEQARLPKWHYCDPDDLVPSHHIYTLMEQAARSLGKPNFGLLVGAEANISTLGSFGRLIASSLTPYHAFTTLCRLIHLHTSAANNWLTEAADEVWFCRSRFRGPQTGRWQMEQYVLMKLIELVRMAAGPSWYPAKICLQTHEAPKPELRHALGDPEILIGRKFTGIAVPRAPLSLPARHRGEVPKETSEALVRRLRNTAPGSSFVEALRQLAGTLLKEEGPPRIETMAEIAGVSVRSLQRRLAKEGLSHFQIVDQARYQAATGLLKDSDIRITDIALDLGYTDSAHFTRAFKRWAGVTPKAYRSHQLLH